jgi:hypothetical protein
MAPRARIRTPKIGRSERDRLMTVLQGLESCMASVNILKL